MAFLRHPLAKALIIASAMTLCVLSVSVLGPIVPMISVIVFVAGLAAGVTGWIRRFRDAVVVLVVGFFLFQIILASSLLLFGSGPPRLESCIGYLILTCGVTIVFLWIPFGISLFLGLLLARWMEGPRMSPNKAVEATAISPAIDSESTPPPPHL